MDTRFKRVTKMTAAGAALAAMVFAAAVMRQPAQAPAGRPARTPDGKPNMNGLWLGNSTANWDLLAHSMRPAVGQPGVFPGVPVLAAPLLALGARPGGPPGPGGG